MEYFINEEYIFIFNCLEGSVDVLEILILSGLLDIDEYFFGLFLRVFLNFVCDEVNIVFMVVVVGEGWFWIMDVFGWLVYEE